MFSLLVILIGSSVLTGGAFLIAGLSVPRVRYWPTYWGAGLITGLSIPLLGGTLIQITRLFPDLQIERMSLHEQLGSIQWGSTAELAAHGKNDFAALPTLSTLFVSLYLFGLAINLARLIIGRSRAVRIASQSTKEIANTGETYWASSEAISPFVVVPMAAFFVGRSAAARIVIPSQYVEDFSSQELRAVIEHEQSHIARRDDEFGLLLRVIVAVMWISPVSHVLFKRWTLSSEIQCDLTVTAGRSPQMRRAYAQTLLKALHITANRVRQYPAASFSTQHLRSEKMRIRQIMNGAAPIFKHYTSKLTLAALAAGFTVVGGTIISATANAGPIPASNSSNVISNAIVSGRLTAPFGEVKDPFNKGKTRIHNGIDVAAPIGTPIFAPASGVILAATELYDGKPAYGRVVTFQSTDGSVTLFSHLDGYTVKAGQPVVKGERIATVGNTGQSTGSHVHIETLQNGERVDPMTVWSFKN